MHSHLYQALKRSPKVWLITGVAGFIGSNLLETLLKLDQSVTGLDNFSTGYHRNLDEVKERVSAEQWQRFNFTEGDIYDFETCRRACAGAEYVLHQAALASVPRSIEDPIGTNASNVTGFLNMLAASRDAGVRRFVYASSSAIYGDDPDLPKREEKIGNPLSPYAATKYVNEIYAAVFNRTYNFESIGLRYFNIFGPRQDPDGAYAAVIPKWFAAMANGEKVFINGDGETSRDFCFIDNCVQANILAAVTENAEAVGEVYNVACGERTTLNQLFQMIKALVVGARPEARAIAPDYQNFRPGDVRHSLADISKARRMLAYLPRFSVKEGLHRSAQWYLLFSKAD